MENETQIKEYIENKQKDSVLWSIESATSEFNSLIWKEEKETWDWLKLFERLKNDKALLKYAEYKDDACGEFKPLVYDEDWCKKYTNSIFGYNEEIKAKCKE